MSEYKSGDWLIICDSCSRKIKASESRLRWDGFRVCKDDWEPRHSLDFIRVKADKQSVPYSRPQPADVFVSVTYANVGSTVPAGTFNPNTL
jgi:hypothetical protein